MILSSQAAILPGDTSAIIEVVARYQDARTMSDEAEIALADARYTIYRQDGSARKMWSTFILQKVATDWKISAIRNMYPRE